jgi:putative peptidoglycan lipid II flippase
VVLFLLRGLRPGLARASAHVRQVGKSFLPVVVGRGVVQFSSWVDAVIASFLATGAMAGLGYAQMLYLLPIITRMAFFVLASMAAFLALGDVVVALVYRTGRFGADDTRFVWAILAAFSLGLPAATQARLYSSAFYALRDTTTPFRIALIRVATGTVLGLALALGGTRALNLPAHYGVVGLALASATAAWAEMLLLRRALTKRLGQRVAIPGRILAGLLLAALIAAGAGVAARRALGMLLPALHPALSSALVLALFGGVYLLASTLLGNPQARAFAGALRRRLRL